MLMKIQFLSDLTPCRMLNRYWCFEGSYCRHLHGQAVPEDRLLYPEDDGSNVFTNFGYLTVNTV